ncbi:MAG TPA: hypothetical protein VIJ29_03040 [Candidatus Paceibacterota bacterium]
MVEKLRSISKRTSWSLVLKAVIFGVAWWVLPFWLFLIIALYLYFIPITGTGKVSAPFFVLLLISLLESPGIVDMIISAAIFYFILLIKDLLIIDRRSAYEILMLVLTYLLLRSFFLDVGGSFGLRAFFYGLIGAVAISAMAASFVKNFSEAPHPFRRMLGWMTFVLMWQLLIVGLFLPLDFLYQSAIIFLMAAILIDLVPQYVFGELTRAKALAAGSVIFSLLVIVAASARWVL